MSLLAKVRLLGPAVLNPSVFRAKGRYLFILSHMRSRSSVLAHILGSNPEVSGYSELHASYESRLDLLKMRIKLYSDTRQDPNGIFLLDKVLLNKHTFSAGLMKSIDVHFIFLIRDASSTIKSIIQLGHSSGVEQYKDPEWGLNYYSNRLSRLEEMSKQMGGRSYFLESDELVDDTNQALSNLSDWLGLKERLQNNYKEFRNTGVIGFGDTSDNILAGKIISSSEHSTTMLAENVLRDGNEVFIRCRNSLMRLR